MEKITFSELSNKGLVKIFSGSKSTIFKTKTGEIFKSFSSSYLKFLSSGGIDLEKNILDASPIDGGDDIVIPNKAVYFGNNFFGYTANFIDGDNLDNFIKNLSVGQKCDLDGFASLYQDVEKVVRDSKNVVFPDLCTLSNLMVTNDGVVKFIDYDGLQIDGKKTACISTMLGTHEQYFNPKYLVGDLYTKELDKKSLIMFYFLVTFNVDLNYVGKINAFTGKVITLDDIFGQIRLEDDDIKHKVWKCFQTDVKNDYLGEDVLRVAQEYDMNAYLHPKKKDTLIKILEKKC